MTQPYPPYQPPYGPPSPRPWYERPKLLAVGAGIAVLAAGDGSYAAVRFTAAGGARPA
jgi:hypothetical protein